MTRHSAADQKPRHRPSGSMSHLVAGLLAVLAMATTACSEAPAQDGAEPSSDAGSDLPVEPDVEAPTPDATVDDGTATDVSGLDASGQDGRVDDPTLDDGPAPEDFGGSDPGDFGGSDPDASGDAPSPALDADLGDLPTDGVDVADLQLDLPDTGSDPPPDADADPPATDPACIDSEPDPGLPNPTGGTDPCSSPEIWPLALASDDYPFVVHFRPGQQAVACEIRSLLATSWQAEVEQLGFRPPVDDGGACGSDGRFDVFVWSGIVETYVYAFAENPDTDWDDRLTYMVIDPDGPYGGDILDATIAHEFNHACQASDDWWDSPLVFEMTATFMEEVVFPEDDSWKDILGDFQSQPDWSLDRDDGYRTWYMYSAALYLHFLREHVFAGDAGFTADMWLAMRNPPGAELDPTLNEPDFEDALDALLATANGTSFADSAVAFARWRWYTGSRDDGNHFAEGASFPEVAVAEQVSVGAGRVSVRPRPMLLGGAYLEVSGEPGGAFELALDADSSVEWVVQAVPGLEPDTDGELVDLAAGSATVGLTEAGARTLVITALPIGDYDPDERSDHRYNLAVIVDAVAE